MNGSQHSIIILGKHPKTAQKRQKVFFWLDSLCPTTVVTLGRTIKQKV
jgi:hypothetical protein